MGDCVPRFRYLYSSSTCQTDLIILKQQDLIFEMAPAIVGGRGTPRGVNPVMDTEPRTSQLNNFQARYMILYPYEEFHFCWRPERGIWTGGQSSGTSRQIESSLKAGEQFNLREVIRSDIPLVSGRARE